MKKLLDAIKGLRESQDSMSRKVDECSSLLGEKQSQMVNDLIHTNTELKTMLESPGSSGGFCLPG